MPASMLPSTPWQTHRQLTWGEYKLTSDPENTREEVAFGNPDIGYVLSMVTLVAVRAL